MNEDPYGAEVAEEEPLLIATFDPDLAEDGVVNDADLTL